MNEAEYTEIIMEKAFIVYIELICTLYRNRFLFSNTTHDALFDILLNNLYTIHTQKKTEQHQISVYICKFL